MDDMLLLGTCKDVHLCIARESELLQQVTDFGLELYFIDIPAGRDDGGQKHSRYGRVDSRLVGEVP